MLNTVFLSAALALAMQAQSEPEAAKAKSAEDAAMEAIAKDNAEDDDAIEIEEPDRVVCRRTTIVGSKFKRRLCATNREWEILRRNGKNATEDFRRKSSRSGAPTG